MSQPNILKSKERQESSGETGTEPWLISGKGTQEENTQVSHKPVKRTQLNILIVGLGGSVEPGEL
jgi:hypothetical protein